MPILQEDLQQLAELTKALTEENSGYVKDVRLINKFGEEKWYRIHINSIWDKENYFPVKKVYLLLASLNASSASVSQSFWASANSFSGSALGSTRIFCTALST